MSALYVLCSNVKGKYGESPHKEERKWKQKDTCTTTVEEENQVTGCMMLSVLLVLAPIAKEQPTQTTQPEF